MESRIEQQPLVDRGVRAEELLQNETFHTAVKEVVDQCIGVWLNSNPEDAKTRDAAYNAAIGINNVVGVLQQWVAIKEQIMSELDTEEV